MFGLFVGLRNYKSQNMLVTLTPSSVMSQKITKITKHRKITKNYINDKKLQTNTKITTNY